MIDFTEKICLLVSTVPCCITFWFREGSLSSSTSSSVLIFSYTRMGDTLTCRTSILRKLISAKQLEYKRKLPWFTCLYIYLSACLSVRPPIHPPTHQATHPSSQPPTHTPTDPPTYPNLTNLRNKRRGKKTYTYCYIYSTPVFNFLSYIFIPNRFD